jgi:hypothetical protein
MYTINLFAVGAAVKVPGPCAYNLSTLAPAPPDPEDAAVIRPSASTVIEAAV